MQPFLGDREKRILMVVVPLQVHTALGVRLWKTLFAHVDWQLLRPINGLSSSKQAVHLPQALSLQMVMQRSHNLS